MASEAASMGSSGQQGRRTTLTDPLSTRSFPMWFGVLGPPLAWLAQVGLGDLLFELGCGPAIRGGDVLGLPLKAWAVILVAFTLAVDVLAGSLAFAAFRKLRRISDGTPWERAHALALAGMASAFVYGLLLAYQFLPQFFLHTCATSLRGVG